VSYRRGWLDKRRLCSKKCRDHFNFERSELLQAQCHSGSYFEWLFAQPLTHARLQVSAARLKKR
jgi:hypothetical protein